MLLEKFKIGDVVEINDSVGHLDYPDFLSDYVCGKTIPGRVFFSKKCIVLKTTDKLLLTLTDDLRKIWFPKFDCKLIEHKV